MMFRTAVYSFVICTILTACSSTPPPEPPAPVVSPVISTGIFSQNYIDRLEALCYARIQKVIGETRSGRGVIWAECLKEQLLPVEQKNYPQKADDIAKMYDALIWDMKEFYRGHTTLKLLHERWALWQRTIGFEEVRVFKDSYL